jgi:RNA polymerase sigma factor (sigma-70 family)
MAFYEKLRPPVYYLIYRLCRGEKELASDVTQEAFERFFKYADLTRFKNDSHALAYLRQTARLRLRTDLAKWRPERLPIDQFLENAPQALIASDPAEDADALHDLLQIVGHLKLEEKALLKMHLEGIPVGEIAASLNINPHAAEMRIKRVTDKIIKEFKDIGNSL